MFEQFVTRPRLLQLHREGPMREEREQYLRHLHDEGRALVTFEHAMGYILHAAILLDLKRGEIVSEERLQRLGRQWRASNYHGGIGRRKPSALTIRMFLGRVRRWLAFCGRMARPQVSSGPFDDLIQTFLDFQSAERGWSPCTIDIYRRDIGLFLLWAARSVGRSLRKIDARKLTAYTQESQFARWSRCSIASHICHVRVFLRWLGTRQGCDPLLWDCIHPPRIYRHERYPQGPAWTQVRELLDAANTQRPEDVRDRAMMLLMAIYGFRAGEVRGLCLEDIDWENEVIRPPRPKQRRVGTYPLTPTLGNAIIAYLKIRPICRYREVFISTLQPYRPFASHSSLGSLIRRRQKALGQKLSRYGSHGLRHACATYLLARGFTLKQIGDHLGHTVTEATEVYAKVDVSDLMQVGDVDLRELIEFSAACERREAQYPHLTCPKQCAWLHKCHKRESR
ncbi:MAG: tyrosine-type recombinase/integrase [Candidatus Korobacteraceae bacterium]